MDRRHFIATAGAISITGLPKAALAADDMRIVSETPPLPKDLADKAASPPAPYIEVVAVGTAPPLDAEKLTAHQLLLDSPYQCRPLDVAQYFLALAQGEHGAEVRQYAREWPVRANPVIFHFFAATQTRPDGGETAWCAAFINWCILRSMASEKEEIGKSKGTFSVSGKAFNVNNMKHHSTNDAASGSFRCWQETSNPKPGEIVVFKNPGTDDLTKACKGQGHVAFFLSTPGASSVKVLGGNQTSPGSGGAVTLAESSTAPKSRFMKYVSLK